MRAGLATGLVSLAVLGFTAGANAQPLATAVFDPGPLGNASSKACREVTATGATFSRISMSWRDVAPAAPAAGFDARDNADPQYRWSVADQRIQETVACGLVPIVDIVDAPAWAIVKGTGNPGTPAVDALGDFAAAASARYSGSDPAMPTVRYWQVWNEPNLTTQLSPQLVDGRPAGAYAYRAMVNSVATAVKAVSPRNVVVAGGLAPFRDITPATLAQDPDWGPLAFMRAFFCLSKALKSQCTAKARFDVWSHHPYTSGGPTHKAVLADDVSLGDLAKLRSVLAAAVRTGHIQPRAPKLWVTEFSWDSNPPDPRGVPATLLKRWVPQALYEMWRNGVSLVTWFAMRDEAPAKSFYQSGLLYRSGGRKPYFEGFRFPVVAFPRANGFYVWGRTPPAVRGSVVVEQRRGDTWKRVAILRPTTSGIFSATLRGSTSGLVRARLPQGEKSIAFDLRAVPDRFFNPFGNPTLLEPRP